MKAALLSGWIKYVSVLKYILRCMKYEQCFGGNLGNDVIGNRKDV